MELSLRSEQSSSIGIHEVSVTLFECIQRGFSLAWTFTTLACWFLQKRWKFCWKSTNHSYTSRYDVSRNVFANGTVVEFLWTKLGQYVRFHAIFEVEQHEQDTGNCWKSPLKKRFNLFVDVGKNSEWKWWDDRETNV